MPDQRANLEGTSFDVLGEDPPWRKGSGDAATIPMFTQERTKRVITPADGELNRFILWGTLRLAKSSLIPEEILFRSQGIARFVLKPEPRSPVPLQWVHAGPHAIPNEIADLPCSPDSSLGLEVEPSETVEDRILRRLNDALGTAYTMDRPGLKACLEYTRKTSKDFGEIYGIMRPWWGYQDHEKVQEWMDERKAELDDLRRAAIAGACVQNSYIPPMRVWDLYSNRVIPFHALPREEDMDLDQVPGSIWTVSHSWVDEGERNEVWTNINGRRWPVPIPRSSTLTLDHIRVELLNMGATYVWVDVLCLRQLGKEEDERERLEEWKLDVPTIGYIYRPTHWIPPAPSEDAALIHRTCVTYFNGLGLPFDPSSHLLTSTRHWFNRVWTLQETVRGWLPGGLTGQNSPDAREFFARLNGILQHLENQRDRTELVQSLKDRSCSNALDRIAGLAYYLGCETLPLYNVSFSTEKAWTLLIKHMPARHRTPLFLQYAAERPFELWVSWEAYLHKPPTLPPPSAPLANREELRLVNQSQLYTEGPGTYYHFAYALKPCHIQRRHGTSEASELEIKFDDGKTAVVIRPTKMHGILRPDVPFVLLGVGETWKEYWVVVEAVGERTIDGKRCLAAVRWGVLQLDTVAAEDLVSLDIGVETQVVYVDGEQAQRHSRHAEDYLQAFKEI